MEKFDSILGPVIDSTLGMRCKLYGYHIKGLLATGQLKEGESYDLDFDHASSVREVVEFYNLRRGKERIFDDMNNGFGWDRLPKSFMSENTVFLILTAFIRNFYKALMLKHDVKAFGLKTTSRIKTFVFKFISVPAKWIKASRQYVLNIYTSNQAYVQAFLTDFG